MALVWRHVIEARGLRKTFGDVEAVRGVDLDVRAGETFGLLGPNGAGKSTTIHMLVGALRPDAGRVRIDGADPETSQGRRPVGIAPQTLALYEELTAEENLVFFGRIQGLSGQRLRQRVAWGLALAGLDARRRDRAGTFSGGMKRRLNLACAAVHGPRVLVCDEPTVGVDPQSRLRLFENIEALAADGCTVLYTTHYMEEAERLCDRIAILDQGKVLTVGGVKELVGDGGDLEQVFLRLTGRSLRD